MEEWIRCQKIILGYIITSQDTKALLHALTVLRDEYFEAQYRRLWKIMRYFYVEKVAVLNLTILREFVRDQKVSEEKLYAVEMNLGECCEAAEKTTENEIYYYFGRLVALYRELTLKDTLEKAHITLASGGYEKSRDLVLQALSGLDDSVIEIAQDGDIKDEMPEVIAEVASARDNRRTGAVTLGFPMLDDEMLGVWPGDACLVAGFTEVGKTMFCVNVAVNVAFVQKKNVVFATTETVRRPLRRRIISRVSRLPVFETPISTRKMKMGDLTDEEKTTLLSMKDYFETVGHGALSVIQVPIGATLSWLRGKLLQLEAKFHIDLVILDDLRMIRPSVKRRTEFEEFNDLFKEFKAIARTHAGKGVPIMTPYHVSRDGYRRALESPGHRYDLMGLSASAEAERTADVILALWRDEESPSELRMEILKHRDGRKGRMFKFRLELEYQYFAEIEGAEGFNAGGF